MTARNRLAFVGAAVALALLLAPALASAQRVEALFDEANEAYFAGELDTAIARYEQLVEAGVDDADVHFNLGTAYGQKGLYGKAALAYSRALWLRPGDEGAERGLAAARAALGRQRADREGEATVENEPPLAEALVAGMGEGTLAWLALIFDVLLFGAWIARRFARTEAARVGLAIALPFAAVLLVLSLGGLLVKTGALGEGHPGIVVGRARVALREGPDPRARQRGWAYEGERATLVSHEPGFVRVQLAGARGGWIAEEDVGAIRQ